MQFGLAVGDRQPETTQRYSMGAGRGVGVEKTFVTLRSVNAAARCSYWAGLCDLKVCRISKEMGRKLLTSLCISVSFPASKMLHNLESKIYIRCVSEPTKFGLKPQTKT